MVNKTNSRLIMKTPSQLKEYLKRNKRNGEQVMLNAALKDLLDAKTKYFTVKGTSDITYNICIDKIVNKMVGR